MSKVQRSPRSLLALFGIVSESAPRELVDAYRAIVDVTPTILAELALETEFVADAAAVQGSEAVVTVPTGECWFVHGSSAVITNALAATNNVLSLRWGGLILDQRSSFDMPALNRTDRAWSRFPPMQPIVALAGDTFVARLDTTDAAGAQNLVSFVSLRRVRV